MQYIYCKKQNKTYTYTAKKYKVYTVNTVYIVKKQNKKKTLLNTNRTTVKSLFQILSGSGHIS